MDFTKKHIAKDILHRLSSFMEALIASNAKNALGSSTNALESIYPYTKSFPPIPSHQSALIVQVLCVLMSYYSVSTLLLMILRKPYMPYKPARPYSLLAVLWMLRQLLC